MDLVRLPLHPIDPDKLAGFKDEKGRRRTRGLRRHEALRFRPLLFSTEPNCAANRARDDRRKIQARCFHLSFSFVETPARRLLRPRWSSGVRRIVIPYRRPGPLGLATEREIFRIDW